MSGSAERSKNLNGLNAIVGCAAVLNGGSESRRVVCWTWCMMWTMN